MSARPLVSDRRFNATTRVRPLPTFTIVEVSNSCTVTAIQVQNRTRLLQRGIIGDISGSIQRFFLNKFETPSGEIKIARRRQQFWRNGQTLCLTASFIAELLGSEFS